MKQQQIVVVGLGEVGQPLFNLVQAKHEQVFGVDLGKPASVTECDIMHVCFPFKEVDEFATQVTAYIAQYQPGLTIINSTVAPGTTRRIAEQSGGAVVHSPVRGKHARMQEEMLHYVKFIGALDADSGARAVDHFQSLGLKTRLLSSPEASEIAKLSETTYFGVLIAWAQEVERYCRTVGADYEEVVAFYEEIKFFPPVKYTPGIIGGHCVMPNIDILLRQFQSPLLKAIVQSNALKKGDLPEQSWLTPEKAPDQD
jgi:UDP-N-acetyl-D-mannosaminuronate dehydrogenase